MCMREGRVCERERGRVYVWRLCACVCVFARIVSWCWMSRECWCVMCVVAMRFVVCYMCVFVWCVCVCVCMYVCVIWLCVYYNTGSTRRHVRYDGRCRWDFRGVRPILWCAWGSGRRWFDGRTGCSGTWRGFGWRQRWSTQLSCKRGICCQ